MKQTKWGVLGVSGHFLQRVVVPLSHSERVEVAAIASRDEEKARKAASAWNIPKAYGSYEQLLEDPEIEAIYNPLPNHLHLEWIKKCADAGKPILCEKPLGMNAREVAEAIEYTEKRGVPLMEAFMYRFHDQWVHMRELAACGEIGQVNAVQSHFSYKNTDPKNIRNRLDTGGGALLDIGCYAVSSARFIFGEEPTRAVSLVDRSAEFATDILASGILRFPTGQATFTVGTQTFGAQAVHILGSGGTITIEVPFNIYPDVGMPNYISTGVGERVYEAGPEDQYQRMFEAFSEAIERGEPVPTPIDDALNNQKVLDALFRSEESGAWEDV
ncbi:MAG: Gfo/Idh/MocA family protein [Alkalispirochaetaceae bacterium]